MSSAVSIGIHGNSSYINFQFQFFTLPMVLLFIPLFYMPITIIIILRILLKLIYSVKEKNTNIHLFVAITISHFMCLLFFLCDFFFIRLPATGIFTAWCANVKPNRYIMALYTLTYYVNYATMLFPFLVSLMRLILIISPQNHKKINEILLKSAVPIISIYPLCFTFFLFPAVGYCYQPGFPFPFGSALFGFQDSLFGLRNNYFLLANSIFWIIASVANNLILIIKLIQLKSSLSTQMRSRKSYKGEVSLTFTTCSMVFSYFTNGLIVISYLISPNSSNYAVMFRPFGNDLETCVSPWVFYLTHPVFRRKHRILFIKPDPMNS